MKARILVVDDESMVADTLVLVLRSSGYEATAAYNAEEALQSIAACPPSLAITDIMMPGMNGVELAKKIRTNHPECAILLFTGNMNAQELMEGAEREGYKFEALIKPVYPVQMLAKVASLLGQSQAQG